MKKIVFLALALVLALSMTVSALAYVDFTVDFTQSRALVGKNDFNDGDINSGDATAASIADESVDSVNRIRVNWTATRNMRNVGTVASYVDLGDGNIAVDIKGNEAMTNDFASADKKLLVSIDMQVKTLGSFLGVTINGDNAGLGSGTTDLKAAVPDAGDYILNTGFGFTLVAGNKIRLFVAGSKVANFDTFDFDLPFDPTNGLHTYAIYVNYETGVSYVCADGIRIGYFDFSAEKEAAKTLGIYAADDTAKASNTNNGFNVNGKGVKSNIMWAQLGNDANVIIDNVYYGFDFEEVPDEKPAAPVDPADVGFVNASWDNFKINGETNFGKGDGVASTKVAPIDGTKGDVKVIEFNGWAGFKQDIKAVGYSIDGKAVFDDNSKFFDNSGADKEAVQDPEKGGAQFAHRFQVKANVEGLTGEHKIAVVIKLADDTVVTLDSAFDALVHGHAQASANTTMTYNGPKAEQKPTGDVAVVLAVVAVAAMAVVVLKKRETI